MNRADICVGQDDDKKTLIDKVQYYRLLLREVHFGPPRITLCLCSGPEGSSLQCPRSFRPLASATNLEGDLQTCRSYSKLQSGVWMTRWAEIGRHSLHSLASLTHLKKTNIRPRFQVLCMYIYIYIYSIYIYYKCIIDIYTHH